MPRDSLTDSGGGGGTGPRTTDSTDDTSDSTTDTEESTDETRSMDRIDDIQDSGGDTDSADDGGGESDTGDGTDADSTASEPTPDELQDSGGTDTTDTADRGDPSDAPETDDGETDTTGDDGGRPAGPPDELQNEEAAGTEPDGPDRRAGPGRGTPTSPDTEAETTDTGDGGDDGGDGITSELERRYVEARENIDADDVRTVIEDGKEKLRLTASGAAALFAAENEGVDEDDVNVTMGDDGEFDIEYTDEYRQEQLEEGYAAGPTGASEQISGEVGLTDEGSPNDPLEGTGLEAGLGPTADAARDLEDRVTDDAGSAGGLQDPGDGLEITDEDVEVVITEDGTMRLKRERGTLTPEQAENIDQPAPRDASQLERETTAGVTPDYTTAAVNQAEQQVRDQLESQGIDPDSVDVQVEVVESVDQGRLESQTVESGDSETGEAQIRAEVSPSDEEQFGDYAVYIPSTRDDENVIEQTVENTLGAMFSPLGAATDTVVSGAADATGIGGRRVENVLNDASEGIQREIEDAAPQGGDVVEDAMATGILGPGIGRQQASDLADLGIAAADEQTDGAAGEVVDEVHRGRVHRRCGASRHSRHGRRDQGG